MSANLVRLDGYLDVAAETGPLRREAGAVVRALADAGRQIAALLAAGPLAGDLAREHGNSLQGEAQKELDLRSNAIVLDALRRAPVRVMASEEMDEPVELDAALPLAVAVDPLDGSSNIATNAPTGTVFSILPALDGAAAPLDHVMQPGTCQIAAGFLMYGAQTLLALSLGDGTRIFTLDPATGQFVAAAAPARIPEDTREYAINGSNWRHWDEPVRAYVGECLSGTTGPTGGDFNTRWLAAMVGEAYRILVRGGVYLYPGDSRPGYRQGRLRLVYEANPVAMLVEQAGGLATDGQKRILDLVPQTLHQRVPLVFGSAREVERIRRHYVTSLSDAPLFARRSLYRAEASLCR